MLISARPGNSIWMEAGEVGPSYTLDNRLEVSHAADTVTGSKPVDATPGSDSSPHSRARRHLNTWLAFTPCALDTSAMTGWQLQNGCGETGLLCGRLWSASGS
jgi:hypothetical protein